MSFALHQRRGWVVIAAALIVSVMSAAAVAQSTDEQPAPASDASANSASGDPGAPISVPPQVAGESGRIQYVGPDTYILLDAQGRPQPVPGMTYEDFLEAWKKLQQSVEPETTKRYSIESIKINGVARDGFADLNFVGTVHLLTDERVEVPLGLVGTILQDQPQFGSDDDQVAPASDNSKERTGAQPNTNEPNDYLTQNAEQGGFVARLVGKKGERRSVTLKLVVPLSRDGAETSLQLSCPRALSSNLTLTTKRPVSDASVNSGTILSQAPTEEGGTRIEVAGVSGQFRLAWRAAESEASEIATVLSAAGAIRVSIDGRSVRSDARLTVQSYGGGFDRFRVRLPPGAQLIPQRSDETTAEQPKYRVAVEDAAKRRGQAHFAPKTPQNEPVPDGSEIVLVEFPQKQFVPVTIELSTEQPIGLDDGGSAVELAGFEVLGAVRQFGDLAVEVANDWQARWQLGPAVRQVDIGDLDTSLQQPNLAAAFQYDRQPWSLGVRIASRQTRIHVTPQYELHFLPEEARLTVRLNYQVFGARAFEFRIRMEGWQMTGDPLESGGLVDQDEVVLSADDTLLLRLSQASTPRAEIAISMRRPLPRDQERVELPLPVPIAESVGTGSLIVRASPDIELRPDVQNLSGLSPVSATETPDPQRAGGAQAALHFRTLQSDAVFVADRVTRQQEVAAAVVARIDVLQSEARVGQLIDYVARYVPLKELVFEAPSELWVDDDQIEVLLLTSSLEGESTAAAGETPIDVEYSPEDFEFTNLGDATRFRVSLPQPRLGPFAVQVRYRVPRPAGIAAGSAWRLPLILPVDAQSTTLQARVYAPRGLSVALDAKADNSTWTSKSTRSDVRESDAASEYVAVGAATHLPLIVSAADFDPPSATTVDRIWLQTWYSGDVRQDRAAIRFRTAGLQATVELPPQSSPDEFEVLLDGEPADVLSRFSGRIVVRLARTMNGNGDPSGSSVAAHTLELRSRQRVRQSLVTRHRLTPPQLIGTTALSQVYWQIVLPGDVHVIRSPARMSSASQWQWLGGFWGQRPLVSQAELEEWVSASTQLAPTAAHNEYLYTGLAPVLSIDLISAPRWLIVLVASTMVLAIGLVWIYFPPARRGWIVMAVALILAALAVAFPTPALLLAQASALGLIVALLSMLLARLTSRPTHWPVTLSTGSSQRQVAPHADAVHMPPVAAAASTAPTVPLRISDPER